MIKPITGQYECVHRSILKLDYFTSRLDRLTLYPDGHFAFITQERSRLANAAQSLANGQQASITAPEVRREGSFTLQGDQVFLRFADGTQEQGQITGGGTGIQMGANHFEKVSDSTMLPPTNRLKKDMDDIAKGLKIAGTIGGMALKAAKVVQDSLQTANEQGHTQNNPNASRGPQPQTPNSQPPFQQSQPAQQPYQQPAAQTQPAQQPYQQPAAQTQPAQQPYQQPDARPQSTSYAAASQTEAETLYCDQCGVRARPGKKFCNNCGARLP